MFERNTKLYLTYKVIVLKPLTKYMASRMQGLDGSYQNNGHGATKSGSASIVLLSHVST